MIDFYDITLALNLFSTEDLKKFWAPGPNPPRRKDEIRAPTWMGPQKFVTHAGGLSLRVCPQKVLGHWNAIGSDDLRAVVIDTAPPVLRQLGVQVTPQIDRALDAGDYQIRGVHIAHQFRYRRCVSEFLERYYILINFSGRVQKMSRGRGMYINPGSRTVSYCLYDKGHQFRERGRPQYQVQILATTDMLTKASLAYHRDRHGRAAEWGPRLEIRFGDHFFRENALADGRNWGPDTADTLFRRYMTRLPLPQRIPITVARAHARQRLTAPAYRTYLLWSSGEQPHDLRFDPRSLSRHRKEILEVLGIDIRHTPALALGSRRFIDPATVFDWSLRVQPQDVVPTEE